MPSAHPPESGSRFASPEVVATAAVSLLAATLLYAVGRPLYTDDAWWHLSLGRAFARSGPWLALDPVLHTSTQPPIPSSWLSDVLLYAASLPVGLIGLRALHVFLVATILGGAWWAFRKASGSSTVASLASGAFLVLGAYRFVQLRPELATLGATIALSLVLLQYRGVPTWRRVGFTIVLCGLWANLHPGFPLGPVLIAGASSGLFIQCFLQPSAGRPEQRRRAIRLAWTAVGSVAATFANPLGGSAYLLYFGAGEGAPAMTFVVDEWTPLDPFRLPVANLPPSSLAWLAYWALILTTLTAIGLGIRHWRPGREDRRSAYGSRVEFDAALVPLALLGLVAPLLAVRFLWLGFFPLLLLAGIAGSMRTLKRSVGWSLAACTALLIPAWHGMGDGSQVLRGVSLAAYREPHDPWKYHGHAVEFLRTSELEGNLYNSYFMGGFLAYGLAPRLRVFIDGSLHVAPSVMDDYLALQTNGMQSDDLDATALLDRYDVDLYVGIGFPTPPLPNRPWRHTARNLAGHPEWIPVFRSMQSAVYLRRNDRNRENLARVERYYAREGVPFDPDRGLDVARVLDERPDWAIRHGLVPRNFDRLLRLTESASPADMAFGRLSSAYLALGLDDRALEADRRALLSMPTAVAPRRRRIGALLRLGRIAEARTEADELALLHPSDALAQRLVQVARQHASLHPEAPPIETFHLPILSRGEATWLRNARSWPPPLDSLARTSGETASSAGKLRE